MPSDQLYNYLTHHSRPENIQSRPLRVRGVYARGVPPAEVGPLQPAALAAAPGRGKCPLLGDTDVVVRRGTSELRSDFM